MSRQIVRSTDALHRLQRTARPSRLLAWFSCLETGPFELGTGKVKGETIQEQTRQCLVNISAILKAAGSSLEKVVSATVIILEEQDFAGMNEEWVKWFPSNPPARQGAKLPVRIPGMKVSIAAIAEA